MLELQDIFVLWYASRGLKFCFNCDHGMFYCIHTLYIRSLSFYICTVGSVKSCCLRLCGIELSMYLVLIVVSGKWQPGYERLCCSRCMQPRDHNFQTTCVCRVPKHLREEKVIECVHCGCNGCASGD